MHDPVCTDALDVLDHSKASLPRGNKNGEKSKIIELVSSNGENK
jgi:hypothetical protein